MPTTAESWSALSTSVVLTAIAVSIAALLLVVMIVRRARRALPAVKAPPIVIAVRAGGPDAGMGIPAQPATPLPPKLREARPIAVAVNGAARRAASTAGTIESMSDRVVHAVPTNDGTLQFLPGRLEVVDGDRTGRDIRFVRTWGEVPEVTFGRVTGPPYRHIQLKSQTVSRQHARLQYVDGRWQLTNLSQTNPVVVNGQTLDTAHGQRVLCDGDQIEMGEVIFRYHER
jgi:hypothetical protein